MRNTQTRKPGPKGLTPEQDAKIHAAMTTPGSLVSDVQLQTEFGVSKTALYRSRDRHAARLRQALEDQAQEGGR